MKRSRAQQTARRLRWRETHAPVPWCLHSHGGTPMAGWFMMETPKITWMTRCSPMDWIQMLGHILWVWECLGYSWYCWSKVRDTDSCGQRGNVFDGTVTKPCCMRLQAWGNNMDTRSFSVFNYPILAPRQCLIPFYSRSVTKFGFARPGMLLFPTHYIPFIDLYCWYIVGECWLYPHCIPLHPCVWWTSPFIWVTYVWTSLFSLTGMVRIGVTIPK